MCGTLPRRIADCVASRQRNNPAVITTMQVLGELRRTSENFGELLLQLPRLIVVAVEHAVGRPHVLGHRPSSGPPVGLALSAGLSVLIERIDPDLDLDPYSLI